MGLLTVLFWALGHHFVLGLGSSNSNNRTCPGSPGAGRPCYSWLQLVWELVEFLSLVLSGTEATRYAGLAVLVSVHAQVVQKD